MQRRPSIPVRRLNPGASIEQQLSSVPVSRFCRAMQRRLSILVRRLDFGALIEQQLGSLPVSRF